MRVMTSAPVVGSCRMPQRHTCGQGPLALIDMGLEAVVPAAQRECESASASCRGHCHHCQGKLGEGTGALSNMHAVGHDNSSLLRLRSYSQRVPAVGMNAASARRYI